MNLLLWKQFLSNRAAVVAAVLLLGLGVLSLAFGKQYLHQKEKANEQVLALQGQQLEHHLGTHEETSLLLYYLKFKLARVVEPLSALSIGQGDVVPHVKFMTLRGYENQKYDTDFINPTHLQSGNFDLSFLILYLFPLVVIAWMYNLISEEQEQNRWKLIRAQGLTPWGFVLRAGSVRLLFCLGLLVLLLGVAVVWIQIPLNRAFGLLVGLSILYLLFWFALCVAVIAFQRRSHFNLMSLLSLWLVLLILIPTGINSYVQQQVEIPESFTGMIKQRDGYHTQWDTSKKEAVEQFYGAYPQLKSYGIPPEEGFNWIWYYAIQHLGDLNTRNESEGIHQKITHRAQMSRRLGRFFPPLYTQLEFNALAQTDIESHLEFQEAGARFHEDLRLHFYPFIFENKSFSPELQWTNFNQVLESPSSPKGWRLFGSMGLWVLVLGGFSYFRLKFT